MVARSDGSTLNAAFKKKAFKVRVRASDKQSGVIRLEISASPRRAGRIVTVKRRKEVTKTVAFRST